MIHPKGTADYQSLSRLHPARPKVTLLITKFHHSLGCWRNTNGHSVEIREKKTVALDTYWCPLHAQFRNTTYFVDKKSLFLDLSVPEVEGNCDGWQLKESIARTTSG
jgi:hypothetical protein